MLHINDEKLVWFIKYLPISIIIVSAIIVNTAMVVGINQKVKALGGIVQTEYMASQKLLVETQVLQVAQQVAQIEKIVSLEARNKIKRRMDEAYIIAQNIYSSNQDLP
ncbi:hypothetical protein L4C33_18035, partial [Vibrio makurazakiensis]|uniref:hypothetical protein n=1 Tax=Vibrio makurazakiensis TaxID=2910250 RepID=UPI003D0CB40E